MRKVGDKNKKPALVHINLRVPKDVIDFFKKKGNGSYSASMRDTLERAANRT